MNLSRFARISLLALTIAAGCSSDAPTTGKRPRSADQIQTVAQDAADPLRRFDLVPTIQGAMADDEAPELARQPAVQVKTQLYAPWHIEFNSAEACAAFAVEEAHLITRFSRWADVYVPLLRAAQLKVLQAPGIVWVDQGNGLRIPPPGPVGPAAARGTSEPIVRGGLSGLKGKGVTIVVIDSGLDFRHPDFIKTEADGKPTSRISYFWDTTSNDCEKGLGDKAPVTYPNGVSVGTVYTREHLTAELRSSERKIGPKDAQGHGTSCAGVAAGNGSSYPDRRYSGVAPEADLIAVRVGGTSGRGLENTYLLGAACAWVDAVVGDHPAVLTCSFGGQYGGRDGAAVLERQIDARFASDVKGRTICIAAGNEGRGKFHAETKYKGETERGRVEWTVPEGSKASVTVQFDSGDLPDVRWASVGTTPVDPKSLLADVNGITKQGRMILVTGPGTYAVELWTASGKDAAADAYLSLLGGKAPAFFTGPSAVVGKQIATPGTALQAITVGSYDFNAELWIKGVKQFYGSRKGTEFVPLSAGFLSDYSNPGPRRTGEVKPDLVAPGQFHTAARGLDLPVDPNEFVETSGKYKYFNGTSSATPYTAGVVALMLEKNPKLTVGQIRRILQGKATRDRVTGQTPNAAWGYGKLDVAAVKAVLAAVPAP